MLAAVFALCAIGVAQIYSATGGFTRIYYTQIYGILLGMLAMAVCLSIDYRSLADKSHWIYLGILLLLTYVLFFGAVRGGSRSCHALEHLHVPAQRLDGAWHDDEWRVGFDVRRDAVDTRFGSAVVRRDQRLVSLAHRHAARAGPDGGRPHRQRDLVPRGVSVRNPASSTSRSSSSTRRLLRSTSPRPGPSRRSTTG